jgi:hypothetical protein
MPNWCSNSLSVRTNDTEESRISLKNFLRENHPKTSEKFESGGDRESGGDLTFWGSCPRPESEEENWYNWNINNWGTKWDIEAELQTEDEDQLFYTFDSAWGPPTMWFHTIGEKYNLLCFKLEYEEGGMDFWGINEYEMGLETEDISMSLSEKKFNEFIENDKDSFIPEIYEELFKGSKDQIKEIALTKSIQDTIHTFQEDWDSDDLPIWVSEIKEKCQEDWDYSYQSIIEWCILEVYYTAKKEYEEFCKKEQDKVSIGIAMLVKDEKIVQDIGHVIMSQLKKSQQ